MHDRAPEQHVVCFSGGHSSALVAVEVVRKYGPQRVVLLNHDIHPRVEDEDIKRFKREVAAALGVPITYASHPRPEWDQFDVVRAARAFKVGTGTALCTHRLKTEPFMRWLEANVSDKGATIIYYGFDAGERVRMQRRSSIMGALGYRTAYPLAFWPRTIASTAELGVAPPLTYAQFKHANCVGCLKAGRQHWYVVFVTRPDVWARAKEAEEDIGHSILSDTYLDELEPLFVKMRAAQVPATEAVPSGKFWATAKKAVRSLPVIDAEQEARPCECTF